MKKKDYYIKQNIKMNFLYGILILAVAIFWLIFITNRLKEKEEFLKNATNTTATIIDIEYKWSGDTKEIEKVYIEYYVNDVIYKGTLKELSSNMYLGQKIYIYYDLENPGEFIQNNKISNNIFKYFGYLILVIGICQIINGINKLIIYLSTLESKEIKAKVNGVVEKNSLFHKSVVIECLWMDENGEKYIFYSKPFNEPYFVKEFEKMKITELPVRFKNKKRYIVITEKIDKKLMV